jgi:hypothetical protein
VPLSNAKSPNAIRIARHRDNKRYLADVCEMAREMVHEMLPLIIQKVEEHFRNAGEIRPEMVPSPNGSLSPDPFPSLTSLFSPAPPSPPTGASGALPPTGANSPKKTQLESEKARLARLDAWVPREKEREVAYAEGRDDAWIDREADRYRCQQHNATVKHKDFDRGFRNWIRNAPQYEPRGHANGNGRAREKSPNEKLFEGFARAIAETEENWRNGGGPAKPLLDS